MTRASIAPTKATATPGVDTILRSIVLVRGQKVLLDADLARLYGTTTKRLNQQVKRNAARFPPDFMFRLTAAEWRSPNLSQFATGSQRHRDPRFPPMAFTELVRVVKATRALMREPRSKKRGIGFLADIS